MTYTFLYVQISTQKRRIDSDVQRALERKLIYVYINVYVMNEVSTVQF